MKAIILAAGYGTRLKSAIKNIFVLTGHGKKYKAKLSTLKKKPVYIAKNLKAAAEWILENEQ